MHFISPIKILHKHCFQFLLGQLQYPGEMKNKGYAKFGGGWGGANEVHYGKCGSGILVDYQTHPYPPEICVKP